MKSTFKITASLPESVREQFNARTGSVDQRTGKMLGVSGYIQRLVAADIRKLQKRVSK